MGSEMHGKRWDCISVSSSRILILGLRCGWACGRHGKRHLNLWCGLPLSSGDCRVHGCSWAMLSMKAAEDDMYGEGRPGTVSLATVGSFHERLCISLVGGRYGWMRGQTANTRNMLLESGITRL